jgi:hypothetical protein
MITTHHGVAELKPKGKYKEMLVKEYEELKILLANPS